MVASCQSQKQSGTISDKDAFDILKQLPLRDVHPDQVLVQIIVINYSNDQIQGKVSKLESVGHGFKEVLTSGQEIILTPKDNFGISEKDSLLCVNQKYPEGNYLLVNYTKK